MDPEEKVNLPDDFEGNLAAILGVGADEMDDDLEEPEQPV